MKNKKKQFIIILVLILVIGAIIGISMYFDSQKIYKYYSEFNASYINDEIDSVIIGEDTIDYKLKNDENNYYTDNSESPYLRESLLLKNIKVEDATDVGIILDYVFYLIFFGMVGFVAYKFINMRSGGFKVIRKNKTRFTDIAGLNELKKDMIKTVDILKNPEKYEKLGIRAPKGIVLEGDPGNGKTLFARALAGEANINFIATKATDFQSAMMSVGPAKVKGLFKKAEKNAPCIVFIDEFDGIGEKRNYAGSGIDKENNRLITALLNEMDGFDQRKGVLVIAATNSYQSLDPALIRAGRFDKKYEVGAPDQEARIELINIYTKNKNISKDITIEKLADNFKGMSASQIEAILNEAATSAVINEHQEIVEEDLLNGFRKICRVKIAKLRL